MNGHNGWTPLVTHQAHRQETPRIRLQRYIFRELLASFALLLAIVTSVVGAGLLLQFIHRAPDLGLLAMLKGMPFILPEAFPITVPLSFLVACLLTYGRFSDDNEFTAFRMGGLHPWHAIAPAVALGGILAVFSVWLNTDVLPWAKLEQRRVARDHLLTLVQALEDGTKTTIEAGDSFHLSAAERAPDGAFVNVVISIAPAKVRADGRKKRTGGLPDALSGGGIVRADRAWLFYDAETDALVMRLEHVQFPADGLMVEMAENTIAIALDMLLDTSPLEEAKKRSTMSAAELGYRMRRGSTKRDVVLEWEAEFWRRIAMGLAPFAFGLLGAPLGLWSARGSRASAFLLALVIALPVFYPLLRFGQGLAESGQLPAPVALLGADAALVVAGLWFLARVVRA